MSYVCYGLLFALGIWGSSDEVRVSREIEGDFNSECP